MSTTQVGPTYIYELFIFIYIKHLKIILLELLIFRKVRILSDSQCWCEKYQCIAMPMWSDQCARHRLWSPRSLGPVSGERPRLLHIAHCHQTSAETEDREAHVSDQCGIVVTSDIRNIAMETVSQLMSGEESRACMSK